MMNDARVALERLCAERGEDFAGLSRMLGRNSAYIQQYVRRGVPRRLGEEERRKLARYFGVPETLLGGPPEESAAANGLLTVKRHPVMVSAGPGALVNEELGKPYFAFDERWLKALTPSAASNLSVVRVEGDSMAPTLNAGDDILGDVGDAAARLREGCARRQARRAQPARAAVHDSVGQPGLSRLARLRPRRDQVHWPGDLVGPADRLAQGI